MAVTTAQVKAFVDIPIEGTPPVTTPVVSDAEIETIIGVEDNPFRAAAAVARKLASIYARRVDITAGAVKVGNSRIYRNYANLADSLELRSLRVGDDAATAPPIVRGIQDPVFEGGQFRNEGLQ